MSLKNILVADDEESIRWVLSKALTKQGYRVDLAENGEQALNLCRRNKYDLAVFDIKMPGMSGLEVLEMLQEERPDMLVVMMTAESTMQNAVEAMKRGAYDYITKPFDLSALDAILLKATRATKVTDQVSLLKDELKEHYHLDRNLIGASQPMQKVYKLLGRIAPSDVTILISGESGTGKELVARAIHFNSPRLGKPFLAINCAAIPRDLLESELFGHEKGAFTGASERRPGKFEQAHGGTLFLDEIGDMPLELQAKLLRVLQEKEITRTGGSNSINVDVRIVAATNQNLQQQVADRKFREDLFFRLNVVPVELPPLRDRIEDIPLLANFFLRRIAEKQGGPGRSCSEDALSLLQNYSWPGNVRELENAIQRAALLSPDQILSPADFHLFEAGSANADNSLEGLIASKLQASLANMEVGELDNLYEMVLHQMERPLIQIVLEKTRGNQVRAAEILGINRNTLRKKITSLKIHFGRD